MQLVSIFSPNGLSPAGGHITFHQVWSAAPWLLPHPDSPTDLCTKHTLLIYTFLTALWALPVPKKEGWVPVSTAYQSTGTTPLFSSRSVTRLGSEPTGADPKSKSSRRGVYTGGIKHVLVTGEKEDIKLKQEEGSSGHDRGRSFYTDCLPYNFCLTLHYWPFWEKGYWT